MSKDHSPKLQFIKKLIYYRAAVAVFFFICGFNFSTWASRIPAVKDQFQMNEAQLGLVLFMLPVGTVTALPFAGWVVGRFGSRILTLISAILHSVLLVCIAFCPTVFMLGLVLFFFGFLGDTLNIAVNTQGVDVQEMYGRPLLSSFHAMWSLGAMSGAITGSWALKWQLDIKNHFLIVLGIGLILSISMFGMLVKKDAASTSGQKIFAWPDKALWLLGVICFCCAMCEGAMADWSSLYYRQSVNDPGRISTTGYTAFTLTMAFGRLIGDRLIQWWGNRTNLIINGSLIAIGLGVAIGFPYAITIIAGFALVGFGVSTIIPIVYSVAAGSKTMSAGVAIAAVSTIGFSGFLVGPPVIGIVANETGLRLSLLIVMALGILIFFLSQKVKSS